MTDGLAAPAPQYTETELDALADALAIEICLEAFGVFGGGITTRACDLAAEAVLATDQIAGGVPGEFPRAGGNRV